MNSNNDRDIYLNDNNYIQWKLWIKNKLMAKGLYMPQGDKDMQKAIGITCQYMETDYQLMTDGATKLSSVFKSLDSHFGATNPTRNRLVLAEMSRFIWKGNDVEENFARFKALRTKFIGTGGSRSDGEYALDFIRNAPSCYNSITQIYQAEAEISLNIVVTGLGRVQSQAKIADKNININDNTALSVAENNYDRKNNYDKPRRSKIKCFYCKKLGHTKKVCFKFKRDNNMKSNNEASPNYAGIALMTIDEVKTSKIVGILDSGATSHMAHDGVKSNFKPAKNRNVTIADGETMKVIGTADVKLISGITLTKALIIPSLKWNLISVSKLTQNGFNVTFGSKQAEVLKDNKVILRAHNIEGLYVIKGQDKCLLSIDKWHSRMGHCNLNQLKLLQKNAQGIDFNDTKEDNNCTICQLGKINHRRVPRNKTNTQRKVGEMFHTDGCGPITPVATNGDKHIYSYIDHASRYTITKTVPEKSLQEKLMKRLYQWVKTSTDRRVKIFRCDNGGEYVSNNIREWALDQGIQFQYTTRYRPEENGVAERWNATLLDMVRCLIIQGNFPKVWWNELVHTATYIRNRCITTTTGKTPFEVWHGSTPDLSNMRVIGCKVVYHIPTKLRSKLEDKGSVGVLIGYDEFNTQSYKVLDLATQTIVRSSDLIFFEDQFPLKIKESELNPMTIESLVTPNSHHEESESETESNNGNLENDGEETKTEELQFQDSSNRGESPTVGGVLRSTRSRIPTNRYGIDEYVQQFAGLTTEEDIPQSYEEAIKSKESTHWQKAMKEEYESLIANNTWVLTNLPEGKPAIKSRWVYTKKYNSDGSLERYKARFVAKGFSQIKGINYEEVFSPTASLVLFRFILIMALKNNWKVKQGDVKTAFLESKLDEEIYIELPKGFNKGNDGQVGRLLKAIYGLKQASKQWYQYIKKILLTMEFKQSVSEPCIFFKSKIIILVYVDDILSIGESNNLLSQFFNDVSKHVSIKWGDAKWFLGFNININDNTIHLDQRSYITKIIKRFNMDQAKTARTPIEVKRSNFEGIEERNESFPYRDAIGSLLYLARGTRPDIMLAVAKASQNVENPTTGDVIAVKRIIRYIKHTIHYKFRLQIQNNEVQAYCDSDWGNSKDRRSTTGILILFYGIPLIWYSKKQPCVTTSTAESEYVALAKCIQELKWLIQFTQELQVIVKVNIYEDNQACIQMVKNGTTTAKTKHVDIRLHFIREVINNLNFNLNYINTKEQLADSFTKPTGEKQLLHLCKIIFQWGFHGNTANYSRWNHVITYNST